MTGRKTSEKVLMEKIGLPFLVGTEYLKSGDLHYLRSGKGKPVILLHGLNMGWGQWYPNIAALSEKFSVFAIDFPGAGKSSRLEPWSEDFPETMIRSVEEFIISKKLTAPALVGHSSGAWVALQMAARDRVPLSKIIAVSPLGLSDRTPPKYKPLGWRWLARILSKTVMPLDRKHMEIFAKDVFLNPDSLEREFVDYFAEALLEGKHSHPFEMISRFCGFLRLRPEFVLKLKRNYGIPVMFAFGANDPIVPPPDNVPKAVVKIFLNSGHVSPTEESDLFNKTAIEFLEQ